MKKILKSKNIFSNLFFIFCVLYIGLFVVFLTEFIKYVGFVKNNTGIQVKNIVFFSMLVVIFFRLIVDKLEKEYLEKLFKFNQLVLCISVILYIVLFIFENNTYPNFVFSKLGLDLYGLVPIIFILYILWLVGFWKIDLKKITAKLLFVEELFFYVISVILIVSLNTTLQDALKKNIYILKHLNYSYGQKMNASWGFPYRYLMFVKDKTEENSSILIPPQTTIWYATGNAGIVRYFLYPRNIIGSGYDIYGKLPVYNNYDYIMLAWGEFPDSNKNDYGWPKEKIISEKIIYWDDKNNSLKTEFENYDPKDEKNYEAWGIIKIK